MALNARVGRAVLEISTDHSSYDKGIAHVKNTQQNLKRSWQSIGGDIRVISRQIDSYTRDFAGSAMLQHANSMTTAVQRLGGVTRLTASEKMRLNGTLSETLAKYAALGQQAPAAIVNLHRETKSAVSTTGTLRTAVMGIGPAIAASFSVGAVVNFARGVGQFANEIKNLSVETGMSVERLQAFNYVGAGADLTVQGISASVTQLADRLGSGDRSAIQALRRLGIEADDLKGKRADETLFRISDGFKSITDQNERVALIRDLFGRSGSAMLRLFEEDLRKAILEVERAGPVMSKELIDKAEEFDNAWAKSWILFRAGVVKSVDFLVTDGATKAEEFGKSWARMLDELALHAGRPKLFQKAPPLSLPGPTAEEAKEIERRAQALVTAAEQQRQAVRRIYEDISGADAVGAVRQLQEAWLQLTPAKQANARIVAEVLKRYEALRAEVGTNLAPALEQLFRTTGTLTNRLQGLGGAVTALPPAIAAAADSIEGRLIPAAHGFSALLEAAERTRDAREELARLGMIAPQIADQNEHVSHSIERQANRWSDLAEHIRGSSSALRNVATGNLGSLLFGFGTDNRELKRSAEEAHQEYLKIQRSGKSTAEELSLAFQRWRDAEERANRGFGERFTDLWQGIKASIQNVLNDTLQWFTNSFLNGMLGALRGQQGAWRSAFSGLLGGGGGGGGVAQLAGSALPGLLGGGAGTAATWTAGSTVFGSGVPGAAGGAGGMGFLANPAFWTNPWTIAGIGAFALGMAVWKKGLFRGGWEGVEGNKRRDKFLGQWGDPSDKGVTGAGHKLASELTEMTGEHGGGSLYRNLQRADSKKEFESAQDAIIRLYASKKSKKKIQKFHEGGVIGAEDAPTSQLFAGETTIKALRGESVLTRQATAMLGKPRIDVLNSGGSGLLSLLQTLPFGLGLGRSFQIGGPGISYPRGYTGPRDREGLSRWLHEQNAQRMIAPARPRAELIAPISGAAVGAAGSAPVTINHNVTVKIDGQLDRNVIREHVFPALKDAMRLNTDSLATHMRQYVPL